jgi:hypothetical protein
MVAPGCRYGAVRISGGIPFLEFREDDTATTPGTILPDWVCGAIYNYNQ